MSVPLSLPALRAFAEVGRQGSVKRAAVMLGVTPGAVSQQVKALERRLGVMLLERGNRGVRLTDDGHRLVERLSGAFHQIDEAVVHIERRRPHRETLTVSTTPSFAAAWLVPRLGGFSLQHPAIEIRVDSSVRPVDLLSEPIDVALRHGSGDYPGLAALRLYPPSLVAVASPKLLETGPPLRRAQDCLAYPLIQDRNRTDWTMWLKAHGLRDPDEQAARGPSFENDLLLLQAAITGQGLALVRDIYARNELQAGRIVTVLDNPLPTAQAYFFVTRPNTAATPKVIAFRDWLVHQLVI